MIGELLLGKTQWLQVFLEEDDAGMCCSSVLGDHGMLCLFVIIEYVNIVGV